jgi:hypothetical protein
LPWKARYFFLNEILDGMVLVTAVDPLYLNQQPFDTASSVTGISAISLELYGVF